MRLVVADTNVLLKAFLSPDGRRRKFLVVCAYGAYNYYLHVGPSERERLEEELRHAVGSVLGGIQIEELIAAARDRQAFLAEQLPSVTPDDLCLVASQALLDEVEEKVAEVGPQMLHEKMVPDMPARVRRTLATLSAVIVPQFDVSDVPEHTEGRDRDDDSIIDSAFRGGAFAIVADDKRHIALSDEGTTYRHPMTGAEIDAYQFEPFVREHVNTYHFDLDDVAGSLLADAVERPRQAD